MSRSDYERLGVLLREREIEVQQLRAQLTTVTAELKERASMGSLQDMAAKLNDAEYALSRVTSQARATICEWDERFDAERATHTETRAELAKSEARVKAAASLLVKSVGQCSHCGERAPLMEGAKLPSHKLKLVCVYGWGCSEEIRNELG